MNEKILISIVSYKEIELENTVHSLYLHAKYRDRLLFSVVSQAENHPDLSLIPPSQLRYTMFFPEESWGVSWARSIAQSHFSDYEYYLQLDAHMFSEPDWDVKIINTFNEAKRKHKNPVLTAYPARYRLEASGERYIYPGQRHASPVVSGSRFRVWPDHKFFDEFTEVFYLQGACLFATRQFVEEVPIDPEVDFFAEEPTLSIRAFAKGYQVVNFLTPMFYHLYVPERNLIGSNIKPWNDGNPNVDHLNNTARGNAVMQGKVSGIYGLTKKQIDEFVRKTGYIIDTPHGSTGLPISDNVKNPND